ncbi:ferredoxin [Faecalimonas sp.]
MKAKVNEGCISCGMCVSLCPEVFRFNDEGIAEAYVDISEETLESAENARDNCPVSVIDLN